MRGELLSLGYVTKEDIKKIDTEIATVAQQKYDDLPVAVLPPLALVQYRKTEDFIKTLEPDFGETALKLGIINSQQYTLAKYAYLRNSSAACSSEKSRNLSEIIFRRDGLKTEFQPEEVHPDRLLQDKNGLYWQDLNEDYVLYGWPLNSDIEIIKCSFDGFEADAEDFKKAFSKKIRSIFSPFRPSMGDSYYE